MDAVVLVAAEHDLPHGHRVENLDGALGWELFDLNLDGAEPSYKHVAADVRRHRVKLKLLPKLINELNRFRDFVAFLLIVFRHLVEVA